MGIHSDSTYTSSVHRNTTPIELDTMQYPRNGFRSDKSTPSNAHAKRPSLAEEQPAFPSQVSTPRPRSIYDSNTELHAFDPSHDVPGAAEPEFSLPPVDTGKDAWLFLFSAFVLEVLVWGTGVLLPHHAQLRLIPSRLPFCVWHISRVLHIPPALPG